MEADPKAQEIITRFEQMKQGRYNFDEQFQSIVSFVRPNASDFNRTTFSGESRTDKIYDSTARYASTTLAGGLQSFLTNAADRWFNVLVSGDPHEIAQDHDALRWMEDVNDIIFSEYSREEANLSPALHEAYLDLVAFGTSVLNQEWRDDHLLFRAFPLAHCWVDENSDGEIDTVIRQVALTTRQLFQQFPNDKLPKDVHEAREKQPAKVWAVLHAVMPRTDREYGKRDKKNKAFASCWILCATKTILDEGGYDELPYACPRWSKLAHEVYGRSPAMDCLPSIKMLNAMKKTTIRAAQKIVDPPLQATSDGFVMPIATTPGSIIFREPGTEPMIPLETRANIPVSLEMMEAERQFILQAFYYDVLISELKKERQSVPEIWMRREEKLSQLAPIVNRLESELLGPMVIRSYNILRANGKFPDAPESLNGRSLKLSFVSPASRAQLASKAAAANQWLQTVIPMAQVNPGILDRVDFDQLAESLALWGNVPRRVIRTDAQVEDLRSAREQEEQMAAVAGAAEPVSSAVLNIAKAQQLQTGT